MSPAAVRTPLGALAGQRRRLDFLSNITNISVLAIRLIALENLVIALLAGSSEYQLQLARDMVAYIEPRPGYTPHPMTLHAAAQMTHLVGRASHFEET